MINLTPIRYPLLFKRAIKRINEENQKTLYLTFDDGPCNSNTLKILDVLDEYNAKASFFCVGKQSIKNNNIIDEILKRKHTLGNHGMTHKSAFLTSGKKWIKDVLKPSPVSNSRFFRPPYGRMTHCQYKILEKQYKIVLWDVLSMDYNRNYSSDKITNIIKKYTRNGSIILFHDNKCFADRNIPALINCLEYFSNKAYTFKSLDQANI